METSSISSLEEVEKQLEALRNELYSEEKRLGIADLPARLKHKVNYTHNETTKCDDRCMYAKGWDCTCSCGGANHGRGYIERIESEWPQIRDRIQSQLRTLVVLKKQFLEPPRNTEEYWAAGKGDDVVFVKGDYDGLEGKCFWVGKNKLSDGMRAGVRNVYDPAFDTTIDTVWCNLEDLRVK